MLAFEYKNWQASNWTSFETSIIENRLREVDALWQSKDEVNAKWVISLRLVIDMMIIKTYVATSNKIQRTWRKSNEGFICSDMGAGDQ